MTIRLVRSDDEPAFIRHARTETLKSIGETPTPAAIEASHFAFYVLAYDHAENTRPIALAEFAFLDQVYRSFADSPYPASLRLDRFCPIEHMTGIRTIYVESGHRQRAGSLYLQLILAAGRIASALGARFCTATTNAADPYLNRLYAKTGGHPLEVIRIEDLAACDVAPWMFHIPKLLESRLMRRGAAGASFDLDLNLARTIRTKTARDQQLQCA